MGTGYRLVAVAVLLAAAFGVCTQYAGVDLRQYPEENEVVENPDEYDGERTLLFGTAASVSPDREEMRLFVDKLDVVGFGPGGATKETLTHELTVLVSSPGTLEGVELGSEVQVFGTLRDGGSVLVAEEEEVVVDIQNSEDWWYVILTSLLGASLAAVYFLRHWRIDLRRLHFVVREATDGQQKDEEEGVEVENG